MMQVAGVVQRVDGDHVWVEVQKTSGCGRCHEPGGCGGVNITRALDVESKVFRVANAVGARDGERVGLLIEEGLPLRAALLVYGLPVLGVIVGAFAGTALAGAGREDPAALAGALAGLALGFFAARHLWQHKTSPLRLVRDGDDAGCSA